MKHKGVKYPAIIATIIAGVLAIEGGYVNHPSDPGGETNYGITKKVAEANGYTGSMIDLPKEVASEIYIDQYVISPKFHLVLEVSEPVAAKLIDAGVNVGQNRAAKWYQQSLNSFSRGCKDYPCIVEDGFIGSATIKAHENLRHKRGSAISCKLLLRGINTLQGHHYMSLTHLSDFNVGWFQHRINNVSEEQCK